jgi:hypothetical protein
MTTETNETNKPTPQILGLSGVWSWEHFPAALIEYADDAVLAEEFIDMLSSSIMLAGVSPSHVSYQFQTDPLTVKQLGAITLSLLYLFVNREADTERPRATKCFTFQLVEVDTQIKLQMSHYVTTDTSNILPNLVFTTSEETPADSKDWLKSAMTHDNQTCVDLAPARAELTMRPLHGWLKEVAEKQHFSLNELAVLLVPAFEHEIDYTAMMSLLAEELKGEMRVLDKDHLAFTLIVSPSETDQYDMVSLIYRSQRLNAADGKNVLHIDCKLQWAQVVIGPVIFPDVVVTQKIEYTGDLIHHAMIAKQFEFQRIAAQLSNDESITERLEVFFNQEESIVSVLLADLEKIGISRLVNRITLSVVDAPRSGRAQLQVMITFFNEGIVKVAEVLQGWVYDEGSNDFIPTADFDTIKVNPEKIAKVARAEDEKRAGIIHKTDLGHFTSVADQLRPLPDHIKGEYVCTPSVDPETPVSGPHEFDVSITMEFAHQQVPYPVMRAFMGVFPGIFQKFEEMWAIMEKAGHFTKNPVVKFSMVGHVCDQADSHKSNLELTLTHEVYLDTGVSAHTQVIAILVN